MTVQTQVSTEPGSVEGQLRDYRSFSTVESPPGWISAVQDQVGAWLRKHKQMDVDLAVSGPHGQAPRSLSVRHHRSGRDQAVRIVLDEDDSATGHWTTEVTAVEYERGGGWVSVDVSNDQGRFVAVPWVARFLLDALALRDGDVELSSGPRVIHADGVVELVDLLNHPARRGAVFVAGTDTRLQFDPFVTKLNDWGNQVIGLGHVLVLDPAATVEFSERIGEAWEVPAWTVRTYLPGLDRAAPPRQHRILSTSRLGRNSDTSLRTMLGTFARNAVGQHPTATPLANWRRKFDRLENAALTEAMTSGPVPHNPQQAPAPLARPVAATLAPPALEAPTVVQEPHPHLAELERVRRTLGVSDLSEDSLRHIASQLATPLIDPGVLDAAARRIEHQQARIETLESEVNELKDQVLDEQVEHLETREEMERNADRANWLGRQLVAVGQHELAHQPPPEDAATAYPGSYAELLQCAEALHEKGVRITAKSSVVRELDGIDPLGKTLRNAWDALLVLADYVRGRNAGDVQTHVHGYLSNTPMGYRGMPTRRHARTETSVTMNRFGEERSFPVPFEVHESGSIVMTAHFKLGRIGRRSPRMYYLDHAASKTIYVGYIGPHLTNTQT